VGYGNVKDANEAKDQADICLIALFTIDDRQACLTASSITTAGRLSRNRKTINQNKKGKYEIRY